MAVTGYRAASGILLILGIWLFLKMYPEKRWRTTSAFVGFMVFLSFEVILWVFSERCSAISALPIVFWGLWNAFLLRQFYLCRYSTALLWQWICCAAAVLLRMAAPPGENGQAAGKAGAGIQMIWCYCFLFFAVLFCIFWWEKICRWIRKRLDDEKLVWLFCAVSGYLLLLTLILEVRYRRYTIKELLVSVGFFIALAAVVLVLGAVLTFRENQFEKKELQFQRDTLQREQRMIREYTEEDRRRQHDVKHMILYLQKCAAEGDIDKISAYLNNYTKEMEQIGQNVWTGISEVDFVVNYQYQKMKKKGIEFSLKIDVHMVPMAEADTMILLGNLLDNAVEAAQQCAPGKRRIYMSLQNKNEMFRLLLRNTYKGKVRKEGERFISSKEDPGRHGWGIENVKQIVGKYNGEAEFTYNDTYFQAGIIIYAQEDI